MNRKSYMRYLIFGLLVSFFLAGQAIAGLGAVDSVLIDESVEGVNPTVQVLSPTGTDITAARVSNLTALPEYVSFRLLINNSGSGDKAYSDLFEDTIGGTLSDRLWIYFDPAALQNGGLLVTFWSDGADPALFRTDVTFHYDLDAVETGSFQHMGTALNTGIGAGNYEFFAKSDAPVGETVPEPSTFLLLGAGLAGIGIMRRKFKK